MLFSLSSYQPSVGIGLLKMRVLNKSISPVFFLALLASCSKMSGHFSDPHVWHPFPPGQFTCGGRGRLYQCLQFVENAPAKPFFVYSWYICKESALDMTRQ